MKVDDTEAYPLNRIGLPTRIAIYVAVGIVAALAPAFTASPLHYLELALLVASWILLDRVLVRYRYPWRGASLVSAILQVAAMVVLANLLRMDFVIIAVLPVIAEPALYGDGRAAWGLAALAAVGTSITVLRLDHGSHMYGGLLSWLAAIAFTRLLGEIAIYAVRARDRANRLVTELETAKLDLERTHRELERSVGLREMVAADRERSRIALEIHDTVAHSLTSLYVELQAARTLAARAEEPLAAASALDYAAERVHQSLSDVRAAVSDLRWRNVESDGLQLALRRLCEEFMERTSVEVRLQLDNPLALSSAELRFAYSLVQEGLTNALRHGQATVVDVILAHTADGRRLAITDDGRGTGSLASASPLGNGLSGLAERVRVLGGTLEAAQVAAGGFRLQARWPAPAREVG